MSGAIDAANVNLTLDDEASADPPDSGPLVSGSFRPADYSDPGGDGYPAPAPTPSGNVNLSTFDGTAPNGTWKLFLVDDEAFDFGSIGNWGLSITTALPPPPRLLHPRRHRRHLRHRHRRRHRRRHLRRPAATTATTAATATATATATSAATATATSATASAAAPGPMPRPTRDRDEAHPRAKPDQKRALPSGPDPSSSLAARRPSLGRARVRAPSGRSGRGSIWSSADASYFRPANANYFRTRSLGPRP